MKTNLPEKTSQNGIEYILHGDYYLPDIALSESDSKPLGRWGREYKHFLEENRSGLYTRLILSGKLYSTLHDLDRQAQERYETIGIPYPVPQRAGWLHQGIQTGVPGGIRLRAGDRVHPLE